MKSVRIRTLLYSPVPVLIIGEPGTGKTAAIISEAKKEGLHTEVVIAAIREPADFLGLPIVTENGTKYAPPDWAVRLAKAKNGLLVLDEVTCAPPAVQAALLRVVHERRVGDLEIPREVTIIMIANPPELAAGGWDIAPPLANRCRHVVWRVDLDEWATGITTGWGVEMSLSPQLVGAVVGFLRRRPELLVKVPAEIGERSGPWPSPRSWTMMLQAATAEGASVADMASAAAEFIGDAAAAEFAAFVRSADIPDPEDVLAGKALVPTRGDLAAAVLSSVVSAVGRKLTRIRWEAAWKVIATTVAKDVAIPAARDLARLRKAGWSAPPEAIEIAEVVS